MACGCGKSAKRLAEAAKAKPASASICSEGEALYTGPLETKKVYIVDPGGEFEHLFSQRQLTSAGQYSRQTGRWFKGVYASQLCVSAVESVYPSVEVQ